MELDTLFRWLVIAQFTALAGIRFHFKWVTGTVAAPPRVRAEGWFTVLLRLVLTLSLVVLVGMYAAGRPEADRFSVGLPAWVRLAGVPLSLCALCLLVAAHRALGVHFSPTLRLRADHRLVETGPYHFIRHPIYAAYLLFFAASGLVSANAGIGGLGIAVILILITLRLPREERLLANRFGEAWDRYVAATGRFLPRRVGPRTPGSVPEIASVEVPSEARPDPCLGTFPDLAVRAGIGGDLRPCLPEGPDGGTGSGEPCRAAAR